MTNWTCFSIVDTIAERRAPPQPIYVSAARLDARQPTQGLLCHALKLLRYPSVSGRVAFCKYGVLMLFLPNAASHSQRQLLVSGHMLLVRAQGATLHEWKSSRCPASLASICDPKMRQEIGEPVLGCRKSPDASVLKQLTQPRSPWTYLTRSRQIIRKH